MPEPENNRDASWEGAASNLDDLWSRLIAPVHVLPDIGKIRSSFIALISQSTREVRTDCASGDTVPVLDPLTLSDRQIIAELEERFEYMLESSGGGDLSVHVLGRFSYRNESDEQVRSFLVHLVDDSGATCLYDSSSGSISRTSGAALAEVVLFPSDRISLRQCLSPEAVAHELGRIISDWPAFFKISEERQASPLLSAVWASVRERHKAFQHISIPDNLRLYAGSSTRTYYLRFDIDSESCLVGISCSETGINPAISEYVMERPLLDAGMKQLRAVSSSADRWTLEPDSMLSVQDRSIFSTTIHQLTRRRNDLDTCFIKVMPSRIETLLTNEHLVRMFFQHAGESGADEKSQIDRLEMLTREGREYSLTEGRHVVGVVAAARDGRFVLNTSHTRCLFEYGPVGVILTGSNYRIEQIMPFYSQAAFREELGRLASAEREDFPGLKKESYLLYLTLNSFSGNLGSKERSIERLSVSSADPDRNRVLIHVHDSDDRSAGTIIERNPETGIVSTITRTPRRVFKLP